MDTLVMSIPYSCVHSMKDRRMGIGRSKYIAITCIAIAASVANARVEFILENSQPNIPLAIKRIMALKTSIIGESDLCAISQNNRIILQRLNQRITEC